MKLGAQKRLAGQILKRSPQKIRIDPAKLSEVKESITKADIRSLISGGVITGKPVKKASRGRARHTAVQKRKGRQRGQGSRKGTKTARSPRKEKWVIKIRNLRSFLQELREKELITNKDFRELYLKAKGGFFRSREHMKLFINERGYIQSKKSKK